MFVERSSECTVLMSEAEEAAYKALLEIINNKPGNNLTLGEMFRLLADSAFVGRLPPSLEGFEGGVGM